MLNASPASPGVKVNNAPNTAPLGLDSPMEAINILALLKIGDELVVKGDKAFLDPKAKTDAVVAFFKKAGFTPNDLLHFAAAIKRDLQHRKLKMNKENRIPLSLNDLKNYLKKIQHSQTPPEMRTVRRQLSGNNPVEIAAPAQTAVNPKPVKLHPDTPSAENYKAGIVQLARNMDLLAVVFPCDEVAAAREEQALLGATA